MILPSRRVEDILIVVYIFPGLDDGAQYFDRAVTYTMEILVDKSKGSYTIHHHQRKLYLQEKVSGHPSGVTFQG